MVYTYIKKEVVETKASVLPDDIYPGFCKNREAILVLQPGDIYRFRDKRYTVKDFRPPEKNNELYIGNMTGDVTNKNGVHFGVDSPRFIVEELKQKKYTFIEDKNGTYRRTENGNFVCSSLDGDLYRLEVTEE